MNQRLALLFSIILYTTQALAATPSDGDLGFIDFPNSGSPESQPHFQKGVLLLHSFEYEDARHEFMKARQVDPDFALSYWGEAMTHNHPLWRQQDKAKAQAVLLKLGENREQRLSKAGTEREKGYLSSLDELYCEEDKPVCDWRYSIAMRKLHEAYPEDLEAASFYALSLLGTAGGRRNIRTYMRAAAVVEEVFVRNPRHPGAVHYLIHSYDEPVHAPLGLRAARVYAGIAPSAPHALHMPSHIFMAMGRWMDSVDSNTASARAALEKDRPESAFHALWWKHYSLLQLGRYAEASSVLARMDALALQHPSRSLRRHQAYMRASHILETRDWDSDLLKDFDHSDLRVKAQAVVLFTRGVQAAFRGLASEALEIVEEMKALPDPEKRLAEDKEVVRIMTLQLEAVLLLRLGQKRQALRNAAEAARRQTRRAVEFGPPIPVKPVFELLGDVHLAMGKPQEAQAAYAESMQNNPGRSLSLLGMATAAAATENTPVHALAADELRANWKDGDPSLPPIPEMSPGDGTR